MRVSQLILLRGPFLPQPINLNSSRKAVPSDQFDHSSNKKVLKCFSFLSEGHKVFKILNCISQMFINVDINMCFSILYVPQPAQNLP